MAKERKYSDSALRHLAAVAERKAAKEKAKREVLRQQRREAEAVGSLPIKDTRCSVCLKPTRNFNARINITRPDGGLFAIGICGDCVRNGYTFDKEANVIRKPVTRVSN